MSEQPKYGIGSESWFAQFLSGEGPDFADRRGLTILQRSARAIESDRFDGMARSLNDDQLVEVAIVMADDENERISSIAAILELGRRAVGRGDECERLHEALRHERTRREQAERETKASLELVDKLNAAVMEEKEKLGAMAHEFIDYRIKVERAKARRGAKRRAGRKS